MYEIFIIFAAMKSVLRNILFLSLAVLYTMSTMGYGVHRCTVDGTASLILLFGETPCEWVHSHVDNEGNTYTHAHAPGEHHHDHCNGGHHECDGCEGHSSDCCSTSVYTVSPDQNTTEDFQVSVPQPVVADFLVQCQDWSGNCANMQMNRNFQTLHKHVADLGELQALICVFRS